MDPTRTTRRLERAVEAASTAWRHAHEGLPANPMSHAAGIPATGALAAALLERVDELDDPGLVAAAEEAIRLARIVWERSHPGTPGNPIASIAHKAVIGILAAGILNDDRTTTATPVAAPAAEP